MTSNTAADEPPLPRLFLTGPGARLPLAPFLDYLEACARRWEALPHRAPEEAARVRRLASSLRARGGLHA